MKYTREVLEQAVAESTSYAGVMRYLGLKPAGGTHAHLSRQIKKFGIVTTHFTGSAHTKGKPARNRMSWEEILVERPPGSARVKPHLLRRALIEAGVVYECVLCGLGDDWCGLPLILHVDHIRVTRRTPAWSKFDSCAPTATARLRRGPDERAATGANEPIDMCCGGCIGSWRSLSIAREWRN